jgi:hypothetical protein
MLPTATTNEPLLVCHRSMVFFFSLSMSRFFAFVLCIGLDCPSPFFFWIVYASHRIISMRSFFGIEVCLGRCFFPFFLCLLFLLPRPILAVLFCIV